MAWNWQDPAWPAFHYDEARIQPLDTFLVQDFGYLSGSFAHLQGEEQMRIVVDLMATEAIKTSEIEGETLNRDSVQASLRRSFGLQSELQHIPAAEQGIAHMMLDLHKQYDQPLSHQMLWEWHRQLMHERTDINNKGAYRTHPEPMQVVSGKIYAPNVHFEAPPSAQMVDEMSRFIEWFNATIPTGDKPLPLLVRAGIAHLYFVSIHPFEDGNGRIARALTEKVIAQFSRRPALLSLSYAIEKHKKAYYAELERANKGLAITEWLVYFAETLRQAQQETQHYLTLLIQKTHYYDRLQGQLNTRQQKVIGRLFAAGTEGFVGGLSAKNYISLAKTSPATATRDLQDLVRKHALRVEGKLKSTRYYLNLEPLSVNGYPSYFMEEDHVR